MKNIILIGLILVLVVGCSPLETNISGEASEDRLSACIRETDHELQAYKDYTKECVYRKLNENGIKDDIICGSMGLESPAMLNLHNQACTEERDILQSNINLECEREKPANIKTFENMDNGAEINGCISLYG